jgi:glyoxylase-like metal-dependent hydrolase (beta-lactamase superfamily II)
VPDIAQCHGFAMKIIEIRPNLHQLTFPVGQVYLWCDGDAVTLVDTGLHGCSQEIAHALRSLGLGPADVCRVVITHFHDDHTGSVAEVATWGEVQVLAHALDAPFIRRDRPGPPPKVTEHERALYDLIASDMVVAPSARVDRELQDGDVLDFGGGARVISTPGHTDGSIALHLPAAGVLFTGDTVVNYDGGTRLGVFNLDRGQALASFRRLAELDVEIACVGHGDPVLGNASAALRAAAAELPVA